MYKIGHKKESSVSGTGKNLDYSVCLSLQQVFPLTLWSTHLLHSFLCQDKFYLPWHERSTWDRHASEKFLQCRQSLKEKYRSWNSEDIGKSKMRDKVLFIPSSLIPRINLSVFSKVVMRITWEKFVKVEHKYKVSIEIGLDNYQSRKFEFCVLPWVVFEFPVFFLASIIGNLLEIHIYMLQSMGS